MIWKKITIETTTEAVDMISYTLGELGVEGIEVEDKVPLSEEDKRAMYIDILPELPPDDGVALISCYIDDPERDVVYVEDLCKTYYLEDGRPIEILKHISLSYDSAVFPIQKGEFVIIRGPSGGGKTTYAPARDGH